MNRKTVNNKNHNSLATIGSKNGHNRIVPKVTTKTKVGVAINQNGRKKAILMDLTLPVTRTTKGSRRVASIKLSGRQARTLYRTLEKFFGENDTVAFRGIQATIRNWAENQ